MDEVLIRRVVGVITLIVVAFLLSWLLPTPGLHTLRGDGERRVTIDLTDPEAAAQEWTPVPPGSRPDTPADPAARAPDTGPGQEPDAAAANESLPEPTASAPPPAEPQPSALPARPATPPATTEPATVPEPPSPSPTPATPKPAPEPPPKPTPPPKVAEKPVAPTAGGGSVQIQAGAYSHLDKAEGVRDAAQTQGVPCRIAPVDTAKGTLYRVRCGPYADAAAAEGAIRSLSTRGIAAQIVSGGR